MSCQQYILFSAGSYHGISAAPRIDRNLSLIVVVHRFRSEALYSSKSRGPWSQAASLLALDWDHCVSTHRAVITCCRCPCISHMLPALTLSLVPTGFVPAMYVICRTRTAIHVYSSTLGDALNLLIYKMTRLTTTNDETQTRRLNSHKMVNENTLQAYHKLPDCFSVERVSDRFTSFCL